ncbi:hypothetical protein SAMN04244579_01910 [Azotobacter beijerinckii]|uniref:Uncharacterized protein n=1 Tax=Azotobacter beijerinckii TaxID=170623 RepID=A0A1H6TEV2_9GAMM|nr:hypothetical protein [Azotobacter beijerinckii]SEI75627.1 hypothetical protein SAMN04244579_01910 [Azotobacter beijerinckii]
MQPFSYAKALLQHWGITVEDIPTSDAQQKQESDFLASFGDARVLIEEKTKEDDPIYLAKRAEELERGEIHAATLPISRNETLSGLVRDASRQLRSSSDKPHDFRLMWFTATGVHAEGKYEQFIATLYGRTNILEMNTAHYRRCYYFRNADFFRRADVMDGAIVAHTDGQSISAKLCLNSLSPRYEALRRSAVVQPFGTAVEDPSALEADGTAFILDCTLDRKNEVPLLTYLQEKYGTAPLMKFDLGYTHASILLPKNEP